jgi:ABC-2 type transport system permease protein
LIHSVRIALLSIKLVMRTKAALFFTFLFPVIFLFVYCGIFARGNPSHVLYFFGPVVTLQIMGSSFWGLGLQSVMQRERGSLRRYRLAPIGSGTMVFSSLLANYLLQLPTVALLVACATAIFHMPLQVNLLTLFVLVTIGSFSFAGYGLTIASIANTMQEAQIYNNVVWFSLLFLSGVTVPVQFLPEWIQPVAAFLPATYLVSAFQAVMVGGQTLWSQRIALLLLILSGGLALIFAWKLFRWEKEEKIPRQARVTALLLTLPFCVMGFLMNGRLKQSWKSTYSLLSQGPEIEDKDEPDTPGLRTLENFDESDDAPELLRTWQVISDRRAAGDTNGELEIISPGALGSLHALKFRGRTGQTQGLDHGGVVASYRFKVPDSNQNLRGIELQVRGISRAFQVRLVPPNSSLPAAALTFVPDSDWQDIRLPAAWLSPPTPFPPASTLSLEIRAAGPPGQFEIDVDEIRFY